ncbi:MAG: PKD domain-containing protein, partial [Marivirga sp.]|nr:PKD domain-containing protein [Marivirga sp.]
IAIDILSGNKSFFFPKSQITYQIQVADKEDGSVTDGKISANEVAVNFDYVPEGFDPIEIAQNHVASDEWASFSTGLNLISKSDCKSCHIIDKKSVGPSYLDVAQKYKNDADGQERIASKIISGGSGVWGDHAMSAHPQISPQDAATMVKYIISLGEKKATSEPLALKGTFAPQVPAGENGRGGYLLRAAYKDKGTKELTSLASEKIIVLRNPIVDPEKADISKGILLMTTPRRTFSMIGDQSHLGYKNLDLTGIKQIELLVQASPRSGASGGVVEIHLDSPDGKLIGKTEKVIPKEIDFRRLMANNNATAAADKKKPNQPQPPPMDAATRRRLSSIQAKAILEPVDGMHDIYFVFKSSKAASNQILMQVQEIQFQNNLSQGQK